MKLNTIYKGDSTKLIKEMESQSIDVCLTDFPYGVNWNYEGYEDTQENLKKLVGSIMPDLLRVCKLIVCTTGIKNMYSYPKPDWVLSWITPAGFGLSNWGFCTWQPILVYGKDPYLANKLGSMPDSFVHTESSEKNGHPCPKPIKLWQKLLNRVSVKSTDIILDPFMGSGTTAIACMKAGKRWIGFEQSQEYINIANKRIKEESLLMPLSFGEEKHDITTQIELI